MGFRGPDKTYLQSLQRMMKTRKCKKRERVGLKSTSFTGNWYLCLVSFVGICLLNFVNENGQRKLDLRPCRNNSTDSDPVQHLITLRGPKSQKTCASLIFSFFFSIICLFMSCKTATHTHINLKVMTQYFLKECSIRLNVFNFGRQRYGEECFTF